MVGDSLSFDAAGLPVLNRFLGSSTQLLPVPGNSLAAAQAAVAQRQPQTPTTFSNIGLPPNLAAQLNALRAQPALPVTVTPIVANSLRPFQSVAARTESQELQGDPLDHRDCDASPSAPRNRSRSAS